MKSLLVFALVIVLIPTICQALTFEVFVYSRCNGQERVAIYKARSWENAKRIRAIFQKSKRFDKVRIKVSE